MSQSILQTKSLHKTYGTGSSAYEALKGIDIAIAKGESVAILGKSGSGKSTLMHLLAGLDRPTKGQLLYKDESLAAMSEAERAHLRNRQVGFVFQQFYLQPTLTVLENVILPLKIAGIAPRERNQKATIALKKVGLSDKANNKATDLSGGQKQRVAIARALVGNPEIIFADEPTGNLDSETAGDIIHLLFELQKNDGITLVVVTHDHDVAKLCSRQIKLKDGKVE